jgi:hypothetical protein
MEKEEKKKETYNEIRIKFVVTRKIVAFLFRGNDKGKVMRKDKDCSLSLFFGV